VTSDQGETDSFRRGGCGFSVCIFVGLLIAALRAAHILSRALSVHQGLDWSTRSAESAVLAYRTPDIEWQNMTKGQRVGYFLSEWTVAWLGLFVLGGIFLSDNRWLGALLWIRRWVYLVCAVLVGQVMESETVPCPSPRAWQNSHRAWPQSQAKSWCLN